MIFQKKNNQFLCNQEFFRCVYTSRIAETSTSPVFRNILPVVVLMKRMEFLTQQVYKDRRMQPRTSGHVVFEIPTFFSVLSTNTNGL